MHMRLNALQHNMTSEQKLQIHKQKSWMKHALKKKEYLKLHTSSKSSKRKKGGTKKKNIRKGKTKKKNMKAIVDRIEYDPNRTAYIALITYEDKEKAYIISPQGLKIGDTIEAGKKVEIKIGNSLELKDIPPGTSIHNVELIPGNGGKLARSAGSSITLSGYDGDYAILKLSSYKPYLL